MRSYKILKVKAFDADADVKDIPMAIKDPSSRSPCSGRPTGPRC